MCGIAGYFGKGELSQSRISSCLDLMYQRGPDDHGHHQQKTSDGKCLHLLHSRLSIIDLDSRSRQPYLVGNDVLCFNGEIYNYLELRQVMKKDGHEFQTLSDTEVLAKSLSSGGISAIKECEGMWGFAWFDSFNQILHLCRDRFGEKPLYIFENSGNVYFGSEPKFIFALLGYKLNINFAHLKRYLVNGYKSLYKSQDTFFEGLLEIPPGTYRTYGTSVSHTTAFWTPNFQQEDQSLTYEEAVESTKEALIRSVSIRLRSDVPIAFCLSGGVDSNALISIAKRELNYDVHGFTIMNTDSRYEEREMVEKSVSELELNHTEVPIETDNFLDNLRELINYHDAPIFTITYYAQWRLMKAVHDFGYKVSVSGTAADEMFSGYFDHHNAYLAAMKIEDPDRYKSALNEWQNVVSPIVRNPYLQDPDYFINNPLCRDHIFLDCDFFAEFICDGFSEPFTEESYSNSLLRNRMANELRHESVPVILHEDDLNSMFYSIENRSPFLDTNLFNASQRIPTRHLIRNGCAKSVLRDSVAGLAPSSVIKNPRKVGFNVPLVDYLDITNHSIKDELLSVSPIFDIIDRSSIEGLLSKEAIPNSRSKFLFNFINAKMFVEKFST